jgi:hypothetical protein
MLAWIPIMNLNKEYVEIYFDVRLRRDILKLIPKIEEEFYLISPILSDPNKKTLSDGTVHQLNIKNYLSNYANPKFYQGFQKINFDLISNLVRYCKKFDCMVLVKDAYDEVNKEVQFKGCDWFINKEVHDFPSEMREEFSSLYRQIKLAELLN